MDNQVKNVDKIHDIPAAISYRKTVQATASFYPYKPLPKCHFVASK
jgi:hypothetical protein